MRAFAFALVVLAYSAPLVAEGQPSPSAFKIIVDADNPMTSAERKAIADFFLKRRTTWPDNETVRPIELAADSPVRARFSAQVMGKTVVQMRSYWQQRIFTGHELPPLELASDQDVVKFVTTHRGAIGYVSAQADIGSAKVLQLKEQ
jgi:ABC-type phosphate transport system substrate-binding protein